MTRNRVGLLLGLAVFNIFQGIASDITGTKVAPATTPHIQTKPITIAPKNPSSSGFYLRLSAGVSMPKRVNRLSQRGIGPLGEGHVVVHNPHTNGTIHIDDEGITVNRLNIKRGPAFGLALGYQWNPYIRTEIEGQARTYRINTTTTGYSDLPSYTEPMAVKGKVHNYSMVGNLFLDLLPNQIICPFIGGGIGLAYNQLSNFSLRFGDGFSYAEGGSRRRNLMYQFTGGFHVGLGPCRLEIFYRYVDMGRFKDRSRSFSQIHVGIDNGPMVPLQIAPDVPNPLKGRLKSHEVMMGLRVPLSVLSGGR